MTESELLLYSNLRSPRFKKMRGMVAVCLRKSGFQRARHKLVFFQHTLGVGGVYVWVEEGIHVVCRELEIDSFVDSVIELRAMILSIYKEEPIRAREFSEKIYSEVSK